MTTTWNWPKRDRRNFWNRVRTVAQDCAEPVVHVLEVPGAFVPGASKALEKIGELFGGDLNIPELDSGEVIEPLDGQPGPYTSEDGTCPVFIGGLRAAFSISHNGKGHEPIVLERLDLKVLERKLAPIAAYEVRPDVERVFGAGSIEPLRFFVEIDENGPRPARRSMRDANGNSIMIVADSPNVLDTDPSSILSFSPSEASMFRLTMTVRDPGLYTICLRWFYRIGRELRQHTSMPILIYRGVGDAT
jgi:hypothetical protein